MQITDIGSWQGEEGQKVFTFIWFEYFFTLSFQTLSIPVETWENVFPLRSFPGRPTRPAIPSVTDNWPETAQATSCVLHNINLPVCRLLTFYKSRLQWIVLLTQELKASQTCYGYARSWYGWCWSTRRGPAGTCRQVGTHCHGGRQVSEESLVQW